MSRKRGAWLLLGLGAGLSLAAAEPGEEAVAGRAEAVLMEPTAARLAIWTDKLGYLRGNDLISLYVQMDPMGDGRQFREFMYLENIETRHRQYLELAGERALLREGVVGLRGNHLSAKGARQVSRLGPVRLWTGRGLKPGLWQFVAELRSPDTTETVKRAHAKFVVSARMPQAVGSPGHDTEITSDTTWSNDVIRTLRQQVFVNAGATLTIEPGTLILARGPQAAIVVERGARIVAQGRREAPVVMSCEAPVGQRFEGCWGGLVLLGAAPTTRGTDLAAGIVPPDRGFYGGTDEGDSSGVLEHVRIEFAGAVPGSGPARAGLGLFGVGSGTRLDYVQAHDSAGIGIEIAGGTASCLHCVASGSGSHALSWSRGWRGSAQYLYVQQDPDSGESGIWGQHEELAYDALPRSWPQLYNVTVVGGSVPGAGGGRGIVLGQGTAVTARNALVTGFSGAAIDVRDNSASLFLDGTSSFGNAIIHGSGGAPVNGGAYEVIHYSEVDPLLANTRYEANPDPRPLFASPALRMGAGVAPPSDGLLDTSAQFIGAFGSENWLEGWTIFGPESDYTVPAAASPR